MPDPRCLLEEAVRRGARRIRGVKILRLTIDAGRATGVVAAHGARQTVYPASLLVLAAGGTATPGILRRSGIDCGPARFTDPVLLLSARRDGRDREIPTPFLVRREGFLLSPGLEPRRLSLRIQLADTQRASRREAEELGIEIFRRFGIGREELRLREADSGQSGGALPLAPGEAGSLHPAALPENLYLADATLLPAALGGPHLLTILALARAVARAASGRLRGLRAS